MSLKVIERINQSSNASYFDLRDFTELYKANDPRKNIYGWGGGVNPDYTEVTSAKLQIKIPSPVTLMPSSEFYIFPDGNDYIQMYSAPSGNDPGFPNVVKVPYRVVADDIGLGDKYSMGIYEFLVTFTGSWGATPYKWKMRQAFIAQACCCVANLQSEIECGPCEGNKVDDYFIGVIALAAVMSDMKCLKQQRTTEAIKRLIDICNRNPCANGC